MHQPPVGFRHTVGDVLKEPRTACDAPASAHEFHATQMPPTDGPLGAVPELVAHLPEPPGMLQGVQCLSLQVSAVVLVWIVLGEITGRCCNAKEELVLQDKLRRILAMGTEPHRMRGVVEIAAGQAKR